MDSLASAPTWTAQRIKKLSELWAQGVSCGHIGDQIGVTKNAVIGKARRLGLSTHITTVEKRQKAKSERAGHVRIKRAHQPRAVRAKAAPPSLRVVSAKPKPVELAPIISRNVGIVELTERMCRWVEGDPTHPAVFCGADCEAGRSYCAGHHRIVYTPRPALTDDEIKSLRKKVYSWREC